MYASAFSAATRSPSSSKSAGSGHRRRERRALARVGAPGDERARVSAASRIDLGVELGVVVGAQARPVLDGGVPLGALRRVVAALQIGERRLVRRDHAGARAPLDAHVADRHAALHRHLLEHRAAVLDHVALAAAGAGLGDDGEDDVLGRDAVGQLAVDGDRHRLRPVHGQRLGGEHVLDLAGADAERERAERAVRGGVRVAADDRHARLGDPELRADDVDDALLGVAHRVDAHAELGAVLAQRLDLGAADLVLDRTRSEQRQRVVGRGVVVLGGQREIGTVHRAAGQPKAVERLRARHLVHEVHVDVQQVGLARAPSARRGCPRASRRVSCPWQLRRLSACVPVASQYLRP